MRAPVEVLRVQTIDVPHDSLQVAFWRAHHQMVVIAQ
jgi:hypothetical protein